MATLAIGGSCAMAQVPSDSLVKKVKSIKNPDSALAYADAQISLAKRNKDRSLEGRALYAKSYRLYMNGDELGALNLARNAHKLVTPRDSFVYIKSATMMAYMLGRHSGELDALKIAFDALKVAEAHKWKRLGADCHICIADIYRSMDRPSQALTHAQQVAVDMKFSKDTSMYIIALSTLSNIYSQRNFQTKYNIIKAVEYMEQILTKPYAAKLTTFERARYLSNLGRLYEMQKRFDKASIVLLEAVDICEREKYPAIAKHALNEMATLRNDQGRYQESIAFSKRALAIQSDEQTSRLMQRNIYNRLSDSYEGLGDYKEALKYYRRYRDLSDTITSLGLTNAATELNEKYKLDKRLLLEEAKSKLARQQRNFSVIIVFIIVIGFIVLYRWYYLKRQREAKLLVKEHKQLAKLDAMKTSFFANISHELRTPLTLIMGPLDVLVNQQILSEEKRRMHLDTVWRNSKKLLGMVNELLDLGKIEAGNLPIRLQKVNLLPFVRMLCQGFSSAAEHRQIRYSIICCIVKEMVVEIDREKLEKIINNLISNAVKFTPANGSIYVNAIAKASQFEFTVSNTGTGIHPDDLKHIFDRYYQGNKVTAEGGTGIGLAISREYAELLGGKIEIDNEWGKGVVFKLNLPLNIVNELPEQEGAGALEDEEESLPAVGGQFTVMVVEDHSEMAHYIATILKSNYQVVTVNNGVEALTRLDEMPHKPDLIISDVMMPLMDGFLLLEHLKKHDEYHRIPVIMLTALSDSPNKLKALTIGVDDYITKPFLSNELMARVANLLGNVQSRKLEAVITNGDEADDDDSRDLTTSPADLAWLNQVEQLIRKQVGKTDLNIAMLSYDLNLSERQLNRRIKAITGLTPNKYIRVIRLQIAREAIDSGKHRTVAEISYAAGFETPAYFSKLFKAHYGRDVNELL
ncbi:response regulator [Mucilaginibacter roseus]|uniref:histidine kinase n=1 Tax=Mucilaginibacter roseus TaxID=1528868 RepID=A0ABS8TYE1_9SPHI|nr:response regulator [Mucilaginibacter roseus]MCD8738972.1 response regulator [Mucilaginibacter roseus]